MGRTLNTRLSQTVRGQITERLRHIAAEHGIAVVTVPARGTSRHCPRCLAPLRHCKAPDQPAAPGWKWARLPRLRLAGRPRPGRLAADRRPRPRPPGTRPPPTGATAPWQCAPSTTQLEARAVVAPYASGRDRSKAGPTPRRSTSRRAPRRRAAPSPPRPRRGGQRPEGHATTARPPLPRAATRDQGVSTTCTAPARRPHRARGAALGAGFHLHAHATPPRREPDPSQPRKFGITEDH